MEIKIGDRIFPDRETLDAVLKSGLIKEYDLSVRGREEHDKASCFARDGRKLQSTDEEIREYWSRRLAGKKKEDRPLKPGEEVNNPWIQGMNQRKI